MEVNKRNSEQLATLIEKVIKEIRRQCKAQKDTDYVRRSDLEKVTDQVCYKYGIYNRKEYVFKIIRGAE
jgi:hypothetical protein